MYQSTYFVNKTSGTLSDTLTAYGLAELLNSLIPKDNHWAGTGPIIEDKGPYYQLTLPDGLSVQSDWLKNLPIEGYNPIPFIKTVKETPPANLPYVRDSDQEWADFKAYTQALAEMKSADTKNKPVESEAELAIESMRPNPDFWIMAFISDFRMQGIGTYNGLVEQWWNSRTDRVTQIETVLRFFAELPGQKEISDEEIIKEWVKATKAANLNLNRDVTASQLFNPHTGKGQNRPKADAMLSPANENSFWLLEYLKAVGLFACTAPRVVQGGGIRKSYVLAPAYMALNGHREVFNKFSDTFWNETAVKMDIIAALCYTFTLLEYTEAKEAAWDIDLFEATPNDYVRGFHVATYQQLSANAYTMMNLAFIGLPEWARISEAMERVQLKEVIEEHIERMRAIDENRSEGYSLLLLYRDFISGNQWDKLFEFLIVYGRFMLSQIDRGNYFVQPFSETNMRRLLMTQTTYTEILQDQGFQRVAKAIRLSTIIPQYVGRKTSLYEVRYGLGQTFKKSAHYKEDFLTTLADFMHSYNEENGLKHERHGKQYRENLTREDVEAIVRLVDKYNPQLICNLLLAYGFAKDPKDEQLINPTEGK